MTLVGVALALTIGVAMGLFGAGGSLLLVPAFTYLLGFDAKQAVGTSLVVVGISAAVGSIARMMQARFPLKPALVLGAATVLGAFAGSAIGARLDNDVQLRMFGVVVAIAAAGLGWQSFIGDGAVRPPRGRVVLAAAGIGVGFLTGLLGVGGGFLIVPALVMAANLEMREASSVSLFVIVLATTSAFVGYAGTATPVWSFVLPFATVASAATIAGGMAAHAVPQRLLQQTFAMVLIVVAAYVVIRG